MAFAAARAAKQEKIGAFIEPGVAGGERHDLGLADHRHSIEVEAVDCFAGGQVCFLEMTLEASAGAVDCLVLGERGEEARRGPVSAKLFQTVLMAGRRSSDNRSSTRATSM